MSEDAPEELGLQFVNCDLKAGGTPRCKLGQLCTGNFAPKTIQLKGACASDSLQRYRDTTKQRQYRVMVIGDFPRRDDDAQALPLVGEAGEIFHDWITTVGFNPDEIYITNVVKCRPPKGRKPSQKEIKLCETHIYHEIREIQPELIILLGATSLNLFNLNKYGGIGKIRGQLFVKPLPSWEEGPEFKIIPTYHPSFLLYKDDPRLMKRVTQDFLFARRLIDEDATAPIYVPVFAEIETVDDVEEMVEAILKNGIFAFDTESPDLKLHESPMRLLQLSIGKDKTWIIPFYKHNPEAIGPWKMDPWFQNGERKVVTAQLARIFENEDITKVAHNIKYDMNVMRRWTGLETKGWLWDTASMHHLLYEYSPHALEYLSDLEFGTGDYSFLIREIVGHGKNLRQTYDNIPDDILHPYGAIDAESTYRLMEIFLERLKLKPHLLKLYEEESYHSIRSLQEAEWVGNKIIVENVEELGKLYTTELEDLLAKCRHHTTPEFNPGSPQQVADALIGLGFSKQVEAPLTSSGISTGKDILIDIDHPLAGYVMSYRNRRKMLSTYVENALEDLSPDGRLRYGFNGIGTVNGGLSCRLFHQVPKIDKEKVEQGSTVLRSIFGEDEGFWYFYADYSQIELRIFAYMTGQQELIDILEKDGDIHAATAAAALEIDISLVSKFNRDSVGKPLNFGVIYGSEGHKIANVVYEDPITGEKKRVGMRRAMGFVENFRKRYSKVDEYLASVPERALCNGGILNLPFGRERRMMGLNDSDVRMRSKAEREATNATIQAPRISITMRTINLTRLALADYGIGTERIRFLNTVHDSVAYGVRDELKEWFPPLFKRIAERSIPEVDNRVFPIQWGMGKTWTEAELSAK